MSETSRIIQLSNRIATNTARVDAYLVAHSLPALSFAEDAPLDFPIPSTELEISAARRAVIQDAEELRQLMLGPREHVLSYRAGELQSLQAIANLGLAKTVPIGGQATFADIAAGSGIAESVTRKLIRHAVARRIFFEPSLGVVTHSAASRLLAEDADFSGMIQWYTECLWPAHCHGLEAIKRWPGSDEPHQIAFALAHYPPGSVPNSEMSLFDYLATQPEKHSYFAAAMRSFIGLRGLEMKQTVEGWRDGWRSLLPLSEPGVVVDVGGSHGELAIELARNFPASEIKGITVQDVDAIMIHGADAKKPEDVKDRVTYMVHDFFTEQPIKGADIYVLRAVLHNWSDGYCVKILRSLIPALKVGAHVVVNDAIYPEPELGGGLGLRDPVAATTSSDLSLWVLGNGGHRDLQEFQKLFEKAGPGFKYKAAEKGIASDLWYVVVEWVGEGLD